MRLSLSQKTVEEEREGAWLRAVESGESCAKEISHVTGLSLRRVYERLARARENRVEDVEECDDGERGMPEIDDGPVLHLTVDPRRESAEWYDLGSDHTSRDHLGGPVLVANRRGTRLRRQRLGTGNKSEAVRNDKYKRHPTLKGGVG